MGRGNKGFDYALRRPHQDRHGFIARFFGDKPPGYTFQLHPRDEGGARALAGLNDRGVNLAANALAQSTDHILSFFQMLRTELAFGRAVFLRAERRADGTRSFRMLPGEPLQTSYGEDVYRAVFGSDGEATRGRESAPAKPAAAAIPGE